MNLVTRTEGAQFTPAGVLRLPLDGAFAPKRGVSISWKAIEDNCTDDNRGCVRTITITLRSPIPLAGSLITIFIFSSVLNYLDRQVLATMVDIWRARPEFPFTYADYGLLLSVFSIAYALSALFVGWFIDRVGLNRGAGLAVARVGRRELRHRRVAQRSRTAGVARAARGG